MIQSVASATYIAEMQFILLSIILNTAHHRPAAWSSKEVYSIQICHKHQLPSFRAASRSVKLTPYKRTRSGCSVCKDCQRSYCKPYNCGTLGNLRTSAGRYNNHRSMKSGAAQPLCKLQEQLPAVRQLQAVVGAAVVKACLRTAAVMLKKLHLGTFDACCGQ